MQSSTLSRKLQSLLLTCVNIDLGNGLSCAHLGNIPIIIIIAVQYSVWFQSGYAFTNETVSHYHSPEREPISLCITDFWFSLLMCVDRFVFYNEKHVCSKARLRPHSCSLSTAKFLM